MFKHILLTHVSGSAQLSKISVPISSIQQMVTPTFGSTSVTYTIGDHTTTIETAESAATLAGRINSILG